MSVRQLILDTETTGLSPQNGDRIIEFAALEMIDRQFTGNDRHFYIHPEREIDPEAAAVHGITLEQLADKPKFAAVGQEIADFVRDAELIIHNAPFDVGFLNMEFARMGLPNVDTIARITDTLAMARERYPGQKNSLDALCTRLSVDRSRRVLHGALIDCELLGGVYLAMTRSQFTLDMLPESTGEGGHHGVPATVRPAHLKILSANAQELAAHQAYLDGLDKACGGASVFRQEGASS
ncbi:MAG: DNA polymerase III subunit epsilon [Neisseria sp.]|nr:DNA polymerase III subunit epsilon [Neisseria sp.]